MRVLLVDVDSTIPNLALMQASSYYKDEGYEVGFNIKDPDKVLISCIYKRIPSLNRVNKNGTQA